MFETPVLIIIFKRVKETKLLLEILRKVKPKYLYVSADGPRMNNEDDLIQCSITRNLILNEITVESQSNQIIYEKKSILNQILWYQSFY